jgi:hypothetical protein
MSGISSSWNLRLLFLSSGSEHVAGIAGSHAIVLETSIAFSAVAAAKPVCAVNALVLVHQAGASLISLNSHKGHSTNLATMDVLLRMIFHLLPHPSQTIVCSPEEPLKKTPPLENDKTQLPLTHDFSPFKKPLTNPLEQRKWGNGEPPVRHSEKYKSHSRGW